MHDCVFSFLQFQQRIEFVGFVFNQAPLVAINMQIVQDSF